MFVGSLAARVTLVLCMFQQNSSIYAVHTHIYIYIYREGEDSTGGGEQLGSAQSLPGS